MSRQAVEFESTGTANFDWRSFKLNPSFDWTSDAVDALVNYYNTLEYCDGELCVLLASYAPDGKGPSARDVFNHLHHANIIPRLYRPGRGRAQHCQSMNDELKTDLIVNYMSGWSLTHLSIASAHSVRWVKKQVAKLIEDGELVPVEWDLEFGKSGL